MSIDYRFIGWCREGTSDKVWGVIKLTHSDNYWNDYLTFWGRRGKKLQTKLLRETGTYDVDRLIESKQLKGYQEINHLALDEVYPEFQNDLEKTTIWAMLKL